MIRAFSVIAACCLIGQAGWAEESSVSAFDMHKCVNMGNSLEAPRDASWGKPIVLEDFAKIKAAGFDTVRIPARWSDYTGAAPDYTIEADFMADAKAAVDAALEQDLNVILNIHHFDSIMQDPQAEMRHLLAMWRQIASTFASYPDDLWFETLNEPNAALRGKLMQAAQTAAVLGIRETNPDRIIILGGEDWSGIDSLVTNITPPDDNIVYTYHYYDPFDFTHQKATWLGDAMPKGARGWGSRQDREELAQSIEIATTFRDMIGQPVFVGEFGVYDMAPRDARVEWTHSTRKALDDAEIPWCVWSLVNTFPIYSRETGWDKDMVLALGLQPKPVSDAAEKPRFGTRVISRSESQREDADWGVFLKYFEGASHGAEDVLSGVAEIKPGWEIHPPHTHAEEEYLMVLEGEGVWTVKGEDFPAKAGDMLYASPWESHGIRNTGDVTLKFVFWKWNSSGLPIPAEPVERAQD